MLYAIQGDNAIPSRKKLHSIIDSILEAHPETPVAIFDAESFIPEELSNHIAERGLFEKTRVVVFDRVLVDDEIEERLANFVTEMAESENTFVILEEAFSKGLLDVLKKVGAELFEFKAPEQKPTFSVFALTDALGRRDKKKLWVEYQKALRSEGGDDSFLMHVTSMFFWQVKSMLFALGAKTPAEAGMKPFAYQKAKSFLRNYSKKELEKLAGTLVSLPHDARRGLSNLEIALERFILSV